MRCVCVCVCVCVHARVRVQYSVEMEHMWLAVAHFCGKSYKFECVFSMLPINYSKDQFVC